MTASEIKLTQLREACEADLANHSKREALYRSARRALHVIVDVMDDNTSETVPLELLERMASLISKTVKELKDE